MSITLELTKSMFQDLCKKYDSTKNMSYEAIGAIFEYYEELSESTGEDLNFDISMVFVFSEYTLDELIDDYGYLLDSSEYDDTEEYQDGLLEEINDRTTIIEVNGDYLVMEF